MNEAKKQCYDSIIDYEQFQKNWEDSFKNSEWQYPKIKESHVTK